MVIQQQKKQNQKIRRSVKCNKKTKNVHETREICLTVLIEFHLRLSMNRFMEKNLEYK